MEDPTCYSIIIGSNIKSLNIVISGWCNWKIWWNACFKLTFRIQNWFKIIVLCSFCHILCHLYVLSKVSRFAPRIFNEFANSRCLLSVPSIRWISARLPSFSILLLLLLRLLLLLFCFWFVLFVHSEFIFEICRHFIHWVQTPYSVTVLLDFIRSTSLSPELNGFSKLFLALAINGLICAFDISPVLTTYCFIISI